MKLTINRDVLAEAVAWAARAVPQRPTVPVLAGILITAADDLTLSVFDYDVSARVAVPADVAEPGKVLLPGRVLAEITKALPAKHPVDLALSGSEVVLTCGASEFTLLTMPADDYPTLPAPPQAVGTVDAAVFAAAVAQVFPACSKDDTLPMLTGIRLDTVGDRLTLAATDRYRIPVRTLPWQHTAEAEHAAVIPGRILHDIARGLGNAPASLLLGDGIAGVTCDGRTTTVRLLDPQFVDYAARVDLDMPTWATVDVAPLLEAVKRVSLVAEKNTAVRLDFTDGELVIQAGGGDTGRGREHIPAHLDGDAVEVAFLPSYLVDVLTAVGTPQVRVGMQAPGRPTLFVDAGDAPTFRCLLMALRLA